MRTAKHVLLVVLLDTLALVARAPAMVNPTLQPLNLYKQYKVVLGLRVVSIDVDAKLVKLTVLECCKGQVPVKNVTVTLANEQVVAASGALPWEGETVVAFVGRTRRGHEGDLMFYAGSGQWQEGQLEKPDDLARWRWDKDLQQKQFGTFNGPADRLLEMMVDVRPGWRWPSRHLRMRRRRHDLSWLRDQGAAVLEDITATPGSPERPEMFGLRRHQ